MRHALSDDDLLAELNLRLATYKQTLGEIRELNQELREVNHRLRESESLRSHFLSNVTNELLNPFTAILGLSKAILSVDRANWKRVISLVALIHSEAFTLDFQLRNIFLAARIEAGQVTPQTLHTDVASVAREVVESFRHLARRRRVEVVLQYTPRERAPHTFRTDPELLKLALANLLCNAINFSGQGVEVAIRIGFRDEGIMVSVQDQGIGIGQEHLQLIFDRFRRVDPEINSLNHGHGLGLSVTKAIVELLHGSIAVESELGRGSCFTLTIPEPAGPASDYAPEANVIFFEGDEQTF